MKFFWLNFEILESTDTVMISHPAKEGVLWTVFHTAIISINQRPLPLEEKASGPKDLELSLLSRLKHNIETV